MVDEPVDVAVAREDDVPEVNMGDFDVDLNTDTPEPDVEDGGEVDGDTV